jgi:hypothetical protein
VIRIGSRLGAAATPGRAQPPRLALLSQTSSGHQGDVAALLRRVADSIEALGDVTVEDITFSSEPTADERDVSMTVYYHRDEPT